MIKSACNLGFLLIEELEENLEENIKTFDKKNPHRLFVDLLSNHLPIVVQSFIHNAIGHINLEGIIFKRVGELKKNVRVNQFELFILYGMLIDVDYKKHKNLIDEIIEISKSNVIRISIVVKLLSLLLLKSFDDDNMIAFLKERIRKLNVLLNPNIDMSKFDRNFEQTKKLLLLKRNSMI